MPVGAGDGLGNPLNAVAVGAGVGLTIGVAGVTGVGALPMRAVPGNGVFDGPRLTTVSGATPEPPPQATSNAATATVKPAARVIRTMLCMEHGMLVIGTNHSRFTRRYRASIKRAARRPLIKAPATVPPSPSVAVASPARNSRPPTG